MKTTPFLTIGLLAALPLSSAYAADLSEIRMLDETKITLSEAIGIAEKSQKGRAIEASLDDDSFSPTYEVNIVSDDRRLYDVRIDGVTGKLIGAREDLDD